MGSGAPDLAAMAATLSGTPLGPEPGVTTRLDEYNAARQDRGLVAKYSPAGRVDLLKFFSGEGARFPVAHKIAKRFLPDLMSEGVSESTFSIHSNFATDLRKCLKPQYISDMVFCNRNDHLLYTIVQPKIKQRYIKTYQRRGSEVPPTSHVQSPADRTGQIDVT